MTLSKQQIEEFHEKGFLFLDGLLSEAELEPLRRDADQISFGKRRYPDGNVLDANGAVRIAFGLRAESEAYDRLSRLPRIVTPVRQLLGEDIYLYHDRISPKKGKAGDMFGWHQDFAVWVHSDGMAADSYDSVLSVMIMLDDSRPEKGCLRVIDGSHKHGLLECYHEPGVTGRRAFHLQDPVDEGQAIDIVGPAGSVLLFSPALVHGSNKNLTDEPRRMVFMVYNRLDNLPADPGHDGHHQLFAHYDPQRLELAQGA